MELISNKGQQTKEEMDGCAEKMFHWQEENFTCGASNTLLPMTAIWSAERPMTLTKSGNDAAPALLLPVATSVASRDPRTRT
jgi:hypothetical protein